MICTKARNLSRMLALEAAICENHREGDNDGYR